MTIKEALSQAAKKFKESDISEPYQEAEILLSAVLRKNKEFLYTQPEARLAFWRNFKLQRLVNRRLTGYSSAVLTGHKWFYGLDFIVNNNVLVPRPETELMVDEALKAIKSEDLKVKSLMDVGTGSGCVIISLAKNLPNSKINFYGLDNSRKALAVARKNARQNGINDCIKFLYSDLLNNIDNSIFNFPVLITANLPYLTAEQIKNSPTIQKEPKKALLAGTDGLDCYRRLLEQIAELRKKIHQKLFILCELDETQSELFKKVAAEILIGADIELKIDYGGNDRLAIIKLGD
jgi:release factor glutamine methyltransferase